MQEIDNKEFDLLVRGMMQDAEEEAPSEAWSAISTGLDRVAPMRKRVPMSWIYRTVAGVAVAAGLAAAIIIPRKDSSDPTPVEIAANPDISPIQPFTPSPEMSDPTHPSPVTTKPSGGSTGRNLLAQAPIVQNNGSPSQEDTTTPVDTPAEDSTSEAESVVTSSPDETPLTALAPFPEEESPSTPDETTHCDPFAVAQWDESAHSSSQGLSLTVGGNLQSNGDPTQRGGIVGVMRSPGRNSTTTISENGTSSEFAIPLSVGIGARYYLSNRFALGAGISYSYLARTFEGTYREVSDGQVTRNVSGQIHHTIQYIGVPLGVYFDVLKGDWVSLYLSGGGSVEKAIMNKYTISNDPSDIHYSDPAGGLQFSLGVGGGVQFKLSPLLGLYIDPGIRYYFGDQPRSIRTEQPVTFSIEAGLRFNFGAKR